MKKPDSAQLALQGLRVLEAGSGAALAYAGKLFADFGAEVIKAEPPGGDAWRAMPPLLDGDSALFAWLNTNKRSIVADPGDSADLAWLGRLARGCDVVLDARALTQGLAVLQQPLWAPADGEPAPAHEPVAIDFTWFGDSGPYKDYVATDATCRALAGAVHRSGPVQGAPHMPHDLHTGIVAGLGAFSVAIASWIGRAQGSRRHVISVHEAAFSTVEMEAGLLQDGRHAPRLGVNRFGSTHPASILRTRDGWIGIFTNTLAQWAGLCEAIGRPELGSDPRFFSGPDRMAHAGWIDALLQQVFPSRTTGEWFELLTRHKHPAVIVPTMAQLLAQDVHRERGAFVPVQLGDTTFEAPVAPQRLDEAGPLAGGRAPLLGAHDALYRKETGQETAKRTPLHALQPAPMDRLPLAGLRVVDLTMGWAGPFASRMLADLGAEVIKVESPGYPDWWRGSNYTEEFYRDRLYEKSAHFNLMNRNKLGITLDLTQAEGKRLLRELVRGADAVIENYSAEVLPKLGLDYAALRQANPQVVMLSMPAFGLGNAWSDTRAYGGTLEQASGLPLHTGHADGPPAMTSYAYGDPLGGFNASAALLLGLLVRQATGRGRHINLSQVEGMLPLTAPFLIAQSLQGRAPARQGNRHPVHAPHGCYPCAGQDAWIVASVETDAQWQALCRVLGRGDWAGDPGLAHAAGRRERQAQLDEGMAQWTRGRGDDAAMQALQDAGVPAGAVRSLEHLLQDRHLRERGFWHAVDRHWSGRLISSTTIFRRGGQPMPMARVAPTLGQHTHEVLQRLLGLADAQLDELQARGVTGTQARRKAVA